MYSSTYKNIFLSIVFITAYTVSSKAQIVGSNTYLKGTYVEVGINSCGAYGSSELPPAEYHPTSPMTGLGFVADSDEDGMEVGFPPRCGDYFVPGSPVEGWAIQIGPTTWVNTDQYCSPDAVPGSLTDYTYAGGVYTGIWEGDIASHSLHITQYTILPEDKIYFVTRVLLCNEGDDPITDIYYMRNVDPDNDEPWSFDYTTSNIIVENPPADPEALVTSEGLTYGCFLGIGAKDTNARVTYGNFSTTDGTPSQVWHGLVGYSLSGSSVADEANSISIYVDTILPGECRCVAFAYILDPDDLDEALDATASVTINANDAAVPGSGDVYLCQGDSLNLEVLGADDYAWTWTSTGGVFDTDTGTVVNVFTLSDIEITATGVGGFCGDAIRYIHVHVDSTATANAGPDKAICYGLSTTLEGSGGTSYLWSPATGLSDASIATPIANPTSTTTYTLITFDAHGCTAVDNMVVTVNPLPEVSAGNDDNLCPEGQLQLTATGAESYVWTPSDGLSCSDCPDPITTVNTTTTYTVTGTDVNGCINTDNVTISVFSFLDITVTADPSTIDIYQGQSSQLNASGATTYVWSPEIGLSDPNISNPIAQPQDTTTYIVTGTDANGCVDVDTITINVIGEIVIGLPTAFSPGQAVNNVWKPLLTGSGFLDSYTIYNRWGEVVYEGVESSTGWDGVYNGKDQGIGAYVVVVKAHTTKGEEKFVTGNFTLIR